MDWMGIILWGAVIFLAVLCILQWWKNIHL